MSYEYFLLAGIILFYTLILPMTGSQGDSDIETFGISDPQIDEIDEGKGWKFNLIDATDYDNDETDWYVNRTDVNSDSSPKDFSGVMYGESSSEERLKVEGEEDVTFYADSEGFVNLSAENDGDWDWRNIEIKDSIFGDGDTCTGDKPEINDLQPYNNGNKVDQMPSDGTGKV